MVCIHLRNMYRTQAREFQLLAFDTSALIAEYVSSFLNPICSQILHAKKNITQRQRLEFNEVPNCRVNPSHRSRMRAFSESWSFSRVVDAESCHVELQQPPIGESIHRFGGRLRLAIGVDLDVVTRSNLSVVVKKSLTPNCISLRLNSCRFNIHGGLAFFFGKSRVARESN